MKKVLSMLLVVVMALGMLAGCGGSNQNDASQNTSGNTADDAADGTGTKEPDDVRTDLVLYSSADIGTLDPMAAMTGADTIVVGLTYEALVHYMYEFDENGRTVNSVKPLLAESWTFSDDNLTVTFKLKKGVKFHNGDEMTAEDVLYTFERALTSDTKKALMAGYESAEAPDAYTVVMHLNTVVPTFLYNVSQIQIMNKSYMESLGEDARLEVSMGTGPYVLDEHLTAQSFTFKAFEDYHRGAAQIKTVRYDIISDPASALLAFEAKSFDYFTLNDADVDRVAATGEWNVISYDTPYPRCVYMNHTSEIFDDVLVRQALAYATNKDNILTLAQGGKGSVAHSFFHPELFVNASEPDTIFTYDLEKAKALLAEAGYPNGEGIPKLKLETMETHQQYALAVQQDYAALGIEVELVFTDANTFVSDLMSGNYDLAINVAGLSNFVYPWGRIFESQYLGQTNFAQVSDPVIDELFAKIGVTMDEDEQKVLIHQLINHITENVTYLPLAYANNNVAYSQDLVVEVHPMSANAYYMHWSK